MQSLPVAFGTTTASYICCATIDVTQLSVAAYLYLGLGEPIYALVLLGLTLPQVPPSRFFFVICFLSVSVSLFRLCMQSVVCLVFRAALTAGSILDCPCTCSHSPTPAALAQSFQRACAETMHIVGSFTVTDR